MLPQDVQAGITTKERAFELMIEKPSLIKRPLVESKPLLLGFDEQLYAKNLKK
jgi:arsenate reductase-like glutaredoxin family protein